MLLRPDLALVQQPVDALRALFVAGGFVVRAIKEVGWQNFSLDKARAPLANMGMLLFEPPNVGGWPLGAGWFSTGTMLARTNFAATLAASQKEYLAVATFESEAATPQALLAAMLDRVTPAPFDARRSRR